MYINSKFISHYLQTNVVLQTNVSFRAGDISRDNLHGTSEAAWAAADKQ